MELYFPKWQDYFSGEVAHFVTRAKNEPIIAWQIQERGKEELNISVMPELRIISNKLHLNVYLLGVEILELKKSSTVLTR